jgi:glutathione synthase/RimK-type ligase-like ATP-grasp enzyme
MSANTWEFVAGSTSCSACAAPTGQASQSARETCAFDHPRQMKRIAFATYRGQPGITDDDRLLVEELAPYGICVDALPWDAHVEWGAYDAVLPRSTWDFHRRLPEFRRWLDHLDAGGTPMLNAAPVIRWNMTKRYLTALAKQGIPVVPTLWVGTPADAAPLSLRDSVLERGWLDRVVVKPIVSASAHDTWLSLNASEGDDDCRFRESLSEAPYGLMVQPFLPQVQSHGEWSLVFFAGRYSHAILKRPADGDFRVQRDHGGTAVAALPSSRLIDDASSVLDAGARCTGRVPADILYARVDGVEEKGRLLLMELELVEPVLFFGPAPSAATQMAAAVHQSTCRVG